MVGWVDMVGISPGYHWVGWIDMIGIHPKYQHRGIGRKLVEAFHEKCKQNNASVSCVVKDDDERLTNFLAALGFKKENLVTYKRG